MATADGLAVTLVPLSIPGAFVASSAVWSDRRGFFREWVKASDLADAGADFAVEQANLALSSRNVVRGLHYSVAPAGQAKVVTCAYGELDDVVVDVRVGSPTFGAVEVVHLAADEELSVVVPAGAAHGYCVTSEVGVIVYVLSSPYDAAHELDVHPFDEALAVGWRLSGEPILSDKDAAAPTLEQRREAGQLPRF